MTTFHFIRHGEVYNPQHILYARLPRYHLSEEGQRQAEAVADYLSSRPLAAVISSPRLRARQTAALVARLHGLVVRHSYLIDEIHTPHQGRPIAELDAEGWPLFTALPPGYDSPEDITARVLRLIRRLRRQHPTGEVALVTHGDVVLAVRFWVEGVKFTDDSKKNAGAYPAPCSITTLAFPVPVGEAAPEAARPQISYICPY
jgi:broad specificity phosphatase PhoE